MSTQKLTKAQQSNLPLVENLYGFLPAWQEAKTEKASHCPLCNMDSGLHAKAWQAYGAEKNAVAALQVAKDSGLSKLELKTVKGHFQAHNYQQPQAGQADEQEQLKATTSIPDRYGRVGRILKSVSRHGVLSHQQIVQLFCEPDTQSENSANKTASRLLSRMRFSHQLYPMRPAERKAAETYYSLGDWAMPYLHQNEVAGTVGLALEHPEQVLNYQMEHDVKAADVFVQLRRQLYPHRNTNRLVEIFGKKAPLHMSTESWWGNRSLRMSSKDGKQVFGPDGFATLEVNDGRRHQFQMPMFMEWDGGHYTSQAIAEGLASYIAFSQLGLVGKRFPQLQVEGYHVPLLLVCSNSRRANHIARLAEELIGDSDGPMIMITDQETFDAGAWRSGAWQMVGNPEAEDLNLAELLMAANRTLINKAPIHWRSKLEIDPQAALPRAPRMPDWLN